MRLSRSSLVAAALLAGCPGSRTAGPHSCPMDRTVILSSQEDVERFAGCTAASSVTIKTGATVNLAPLHALETIDGDLSIGPTVGLDEVAFGELREIGGMVHIVSNGSLRGIFLPRLERVGRIEIEANYELTTISLPRLTLAQGAFMVIDNASLEMIDITTLAEIGKTLVITGNPKLNLIEGGKLAVVQDVVVEGNTHLPSDAIDNVRAKTPSD